MNRLRAWLLWYCASPELVRWAMVFASMGALWWSSAQPRGSTSSGWGQDFLHNSAHAVAFAIVGASAHLAMWQRDSISLRRPLIALVIAMGYGVVDELHQSSVPGRVCSVADACTDSFGAAFAVAGLHGLLAECSAMRRFLPWFAAGALMSVSAATWTSW